jgi:hypothetical protein
MTHTLRGCYATKDVWLDGMLLRPDYSKFVMFQTDLTNKAIARCPFSFSWGEDVKGAEQLALAVVWELTCKTHGYLDFKREIILRLPKSDFNIKFGFEVPAWEQRFFREIIKGEQAAKDK